MADPPLFTGAENVTSISVSPAEVFVMEGLSGLLIAVEARYCSQIGMLFVLANGVIAVVEEEASLVPTELVAVIVHV